MLDLIPRRWTHLLARVETRDTQYRNKTEGNTQTRFPGHTPPMDRGSVVTLKPEELRHPTRIGSGFPLGLTQGFVTFESLEIASLLQIHETVYTAPYGQLKEKCEE